jgi:hypothetical protein
LRILGAVEMGEKKKEVIAHPAEFGGIGAWRDFIFG